MHQTFTTKDVAADIGVSETTIKTWVDRLGLDVERDSRHGRRFTQAELDLLHTVSQLRGEGAGYQTITRAIGRAPDARQADQDEQQTGGSHASDARQAIDVIALTEQVTAAVVATIRTDNELAEKYAHAAHRIGQLEAENKALLEKSDEARQLLAGGITESDRLRSELADVRRQLDEERAKPWWRRLLGGS